MSSCHDNVPTLSTKQVLYLFCEKMMTKRERRRKILRGEELPKPQPRESVRKPVVKPRKVGVGLQTINKSDNVHSTISSAGATVGSRKSSTSSANTKTYEVPKVPNASEENLVKMSESESENLTYSLEEDLRLPKPAPRKAEEIIKTADKKPEEEIEEIVRMVEKEEIPTEVVAEVGIKNMIAVADTSSESGVEVAKVVIEKQPISNDEETPRLKSGKRSKSVEDLDMKRTKGREVKSDNELQLKSPSVRKESNRPVSYSESSEEERLEIHVRKKLKDEKKSKKKKMMNILKKDRGRMPKVSTILKELTDDVHRGDKTDPLYEDDIIDFHLDSPKMISTALGNKIYVQHKNGFYPRLRDEVFKEDMSRGSQINNDRFNKTALNTAILFQSYWSKCMVLVHGVLSGIALSHGVLSCLLINHCSLEQFVHFYCYIALPCHYMIYMLTVLCIVSCFDRLDLGHFHGSHFRSLLRYKGLLLALVLYLLSLNLTFVNQGQEVRLDAVKFKNLTRENYWDENVNKDAHNMLQEWFRITLVRDVFLFLSWMFLALTNYRDLLHDYLVNMIKYSNKITSHPVHNPDEVIFSIT